METTLLNTEGKEIGKHELSDNIFKQEPDKNFLHEVITAYLANKRQGSACAKTRAEVSGGGKKPWKQKGTGRARHGSTRSPLWKGGGVTFGPRPRDYSQNLPKAKKKRALLHALSAQFMQNKIVVVDKFDVDEPKTKKLNNVLVALNAGRKPLLVTTDKNKNLYIAGRNLKGFLTCLPKDLNAYDVLNSTKIIITKDAADKLAGDTLKGDDK